MKFYYLNVHFQVQRVKVFLKERGYQGVDWIHMAQDKDRWRIPVNTEMDILVP